MHRMRASSLLGLILVTAAPADAQGLRDYLDTIDLNEYSLGLNFYMSKSTFAGVDDFMIAFPAPSSYEHAVMTDNPLFIRDASIGLRKVTDSGWTYGGLAKIQALGYGSNESEALLGMRQRGWTVQAGGLVGRRLGPVQADLFASHDILGEHNGMEASLKVAWPFIRKSWYIVPELRLTWESKDLINHYFGVRPEEALPGRPAYAPGAAFTPEVGIDWNWRFSPSWYASVAGSVEFLPDEIRNSPVVDEDVTWRVMLSLSYSQDAFIEPGDNEPANSQFEIGLGAFFVDAESNMDFLGANPGPPLEENQQLDASKIMVPIDLTWRLGRFHQLELSYFQLRRSSTTDLDADTDIGGVTFPGGQAVTTDFDTDVLRLGYGFALLRDEQKEFTLFGGLHMTDVGYRVRGSGESVLASSKAFLPVIGARFNAWLTQQIALGVRLDLFELDVDQHSGSLLDFGFEGRYRFNERWSAGAGYRFYRQDINSGEDSFLGDYRFQYRGPVAFLRIRF